MVDKNKLGEAAAEALRAKLKMLEAQQPPEYKFSPEFEEKMEHLGRRQNNRILYRVMRVAAIMVLVMTVLFSAVTVLSPEVRAGVFGWFRSSSEEPYHYQNESATISPDAVTEMTYEYYLTVVPEGYAAMGELERSQGKTYMYMNAETGDILFFSYSYATGMGELYIDSGAYDSTQVMVGDRTADMYSAREKGQSNVLVWFSKHGGVLYQLDGNLDAQQLVALAESVSPWELPLTELE